MDIDLYLTFKIAGILVFVSLGSYFCWKNNISLVKSVALAVFGVIAAYFGSVFWYVFQNEDWRGAKSPEEWAAMLDGAGSVLYGWILAGSGCVYVLSKLFKVNPLKALDLLLPWLLVAQILNRFGCFAGQCCFGRPTGLPWAVYNDYVQARVHPVQLYEAFLDAVLFCVLFLLRKKPTGRVTLVYFTGYPFVRFFLEFFRGDNKPAWLGMTVPQAASLGIFLIACAFWLLQKDGFRKKA